MGFDISFEEVALDLSNCVLCIVYLAGLEQNFLGQLLFFLVAEGFISFDSKDFNCGMNGGGRDEK
nr:hypothetical protein [Streptococcus pneumoniae]